MGYLLIDLFGQIPDKVSLLQKIWSLRPNAGLMNMGFSNYRLIHIAGGYLLNYQTAPVLYAVIIITVLLAGWKRYHRFQVGNG